MGRYRLGPTGYILVGKDKCTPCLDSNCNQIEEGECPEWETLGRRVLIRKKGKTEKAEHFRPITCLSVIYKIQTAIINNIPRDHLFGNKIWPFEQLGTLEGTLGAKEATLFNRYIAEEVKLYRRSLTVGWTDLKKAYDSLFQEVITQILEYLKVPGWIITWLRKAMSTWRTILQVSKGKEKILSKEIFIECGILQGDSPSPTLLFLTFIIISYTIRQMNLGYIPGPPRNRNSNQMKTHRLLMDDLKVYRTSHQQLGKVIQQATSWTAGLGGFAKFLQNLTFFPQILAFLCLQPPHVPVSLRTFKFTPPFLNICDGESRIKLRIRQVFSFDNKSRKRVYNKQFEDSR